MTPVLDFDDFLTKYVHTNKAPGSQPYDRKFLFDHVLGRLQSVNNAIFGQLGFHIVVGDLVIPFTSTAAADTTAFRRTAQCCAIKRADVVPATFDSLIKGQAKSEDAILEKFSAVCEMLNIIWAFVGVPPIVPTCLGLAAYLEAHRLESPKFQRLSLVHRLP